MLSTRPEDRIQAARAARTKQVQSGPVVTVGLIKNYKARASEEMPFADQDVKTYIEVLERLLAPIFALGDNENACKYVCPNQSVEQSPAPVEAASPVTETPVSSPAEPISAATKYLKDMEARLQTEPVRGMRASAQLSMASSAPPDLEKRVATLESQVAKLMAPFKDLPPRRTGGLASIIDDEEEDIMAYKRAAPTNRVADRTIVDDDMDVYAIPRSSIGGLSGFVDVEDDYDNVDFLED